MGITIGVGLEQRLKSLNEQEEEKGKILSVRRVWEEKEWKMSRSAHGPGLFGHHGVQGTSFNSSDNCFERNGYRPGRLSCRG